MNSQNKRNVFYLLQDLLSQRTDVQTYFIIIICFVTAAMSRAKHMNHQTWCRLPDNVDQLLVLRVIRTISYLIDGYMCST